MADYYRKLLADETNYLKDRIAKYNSILKEDGKLLTESGMCVYIYIFKYVSSIQILYMILI